MVLIISTKRALYFRGHPQRNRAVNANRAAKNKLLSSSVICFAEQTFRSFDVYLLKLSSRCVSATSNCSQVDDLLKFVLLEEIFDDRLVVKIPANYDDACFSQRLCVRILRAVSEYANEPHTGKRSQFPGYVTTNKSVRPSQQN